MPRGAKRDNTETMARNFDDERSFVSLEGHEYLYGKDWKRRKLQVFAQYGHCKWLGGPTGWPCWAPAEHIHHILPKSKGGSDDLDNLMAICAQHHRDVHPEKQLKWRKHDSRLREVPR